MQKKIYKTYDLNFKQLHYLQYNFIKDKKYIILIKYFDKLKKIKNIIDNNKK